MSASIRELGGQLLLPGEDIDIEQDPELGMDADVAGGEQEIQC